METVVEVSTEVGAIEEESFPIPPDCEPAAKKKRGGGCLFTTADVFFLLSERHLLSVFVTANNLQGLERSSASTQTRAGVLLLLLIPAG